MKSDRPDPDALLSAIKKEEAAAQSGSLRVFFGMAAGVGKTYAMLKAAQEKVQAGVDVVVGLAETHGRVETQQLLSGLEIIPRKTISYRDVDLLEMDIDAILARKPQLVLVDELAHTNVPGSRHPKRWQDIQEILAAGIDVYTTLNVQHLESRKEYVEQIAGITIRETVPDTLLEQASQITLVDITPTELLQRLREGKVYLGERADAAASNFFKEDRLTALREIALRITAETISGGLDHLNSTTGNGERFRTAERLMVAVSHSPHSEDLIRATRRLAFSMDAEWYGVHVNTEANLDDVDRKRLARNLSLVQELGGEVVSVNDVDIVEALLRVAQTKSVTQLIVGRPASKSIRDYFRGGTLLDRLARRATHFDIHVMKPDRTTSPKKSSLFSGDRDSTFIHYWFMVWMIVAASLLALFLSPVIGYRAVGFLFLIGVLAVGLFVSIGPTIFAAILAALTWNFFFIPPRFTFYISRPEDIAMCVALFVTALVTGVLTSRIRRRERLLQHRERQSAILYDIAKTISATIGRQKFADAVTGGLEFVMRGKLGVALKTTEDVLEHVGEGSSFLWMTSEREWVVAQWAYEHRKEAGWSTDTLPSAEAWYIPLVGPSETVGVLAYRPDRKSELTEDESALLRSVARQLAVAAEREIFQERSRRAEQAAESERLYQTILASVSHEMRTPLTAIIGAATALQQMKDEAATHNQRELSAEILENSNRLNRVVCNLLDMSRLNSGQLRLNMDWHEIGDVISSAIEHSADVLSKRSIKKSIPDNAPLLRIDFVLIEQAIGNILVNAANYTPLTASIDITVTAKDRAIDIEISDNGPGIPPGSIPLIFEPFYRVPGSPAGGSGIGLAIAKGIIEAHHGTIMVENQTPNGALFRIVLPLERQPSTPKETDE